MSDCEWLEDCIGVRFMHSKTDQEGDKDDDFKHVFANPFEPHICPMTALGIYFLSNSDKYTNSSTKIFLQSSKSATSTVDKFLKRWFKTANGQRFLNVADMCETDYGIHSLHKGSVSYCCTASTQGTKNVFFFWLILASVIPAPLLHSCSH